MVKGKKRSSPDGESSSAVMESAVVGDDSAAPSSGSMYKNKQRVLILASRGITARYRYLLEDLKKIIPHHKKDSKLDSKGDIMVVNEIAEMKSCNQVLYLECRKRRDLYMYLGGTPGGPSAKFQVTNIHTMDELKLTGNCMAGSRPLLNFDSKFDSSPHWQLMKGLFTNAFNTPRGHPKSKPFVDRVMSFFIMKNNIWVRNYQIVDTTEKTSGSGSSGAHHLVEIGPRFVLIPIRVFNDSLGGATLYQNPSYVTPNEERAAVKRGKGDEYVAKRSRVAKGKELAASYIPEEDPISGFKMFK